MNPVKWLLSLLPDSLRGCLKEWYNRNAIVYFWDRGRYRELLAQMLFHMYTSRRAYRKKWQRLLEVRAKDKIKVVFQVWNISKWRSDTLYRQMLEHPRFEPFIWVSDDPSVSTEKRAEAREKIISHFSEFKNRVLFSTDWENLEKEIAPDLIFIQDHYMCDLNMSPVAYRHLLCYVKYCYMTTNMTKGVDYFLTHATLFFFQEHESVVRLISKRFTEKEKRLAVVGSPTYDYFLGYDPNSPSVWKARPAKSKKIIWAPHWTVLENKELAYCGASVFVQVCDVMVAMAKKYEEQIQIAFKPHPSLYASLCAHPSWGKDKTEAYYALWQNMPNTQLEEGQYRELFMQSDAMMHDCGSFIVEYLFADKPCMYLKGEHGFGNFNEMNEKALGCYTQGVTPEAIESFILSVIEGKADAMAERRTEFLNTYVRPESGKSASQNIIDCILGDV